MSLIHSAGKRAKKNNDPEMDAQNDGDRDQNLAVAYSIQRKNRKKMALGGMAKPAPMIEKAGKELYLDEMEDESDHEMDGDHEHFEDEDMDLVNRLRKRLARGGMVDMDDESDEDDMGMLHQKAPKDEYSKEGIINYAMGGDVADSIRKQYAFGGEANMEDEAIDDNAIEHTNLEDDLSYDLADEESYPEMDALKQVGRASAANRDSIGMNDMHGDSADADDESDKHDMVGALRRKLAKGRK